MISKEKIEKGLWYIWFFHFIYLVTALSNKRRQIEKFMKNIFEVSKGFYKMQDFLPKKDLVETFEQF